MPTVAQAMPRRVVWANWGNLLHSAAAHEEIGRRVAELGLSQLIAVGQWAGQMANAARAGGVKAVSEFAEVAAAAAAIKKLVRPGDVVLLKASRAVGLERVGEGRRQVRRRAR